MMCRLILSIQSEGTATEKQSLEKLRISNNGLGAV